MRRALVDVADVFAGVLVLLISFTSYGWYLMFGPYVAVGYVVLMSLGLGTYYSYIY